MAGFVGGVATVRYPAAPYTPARPPWSAFAQRTP